MPAVLEEQRRTLWLDQRGQGEERSREGPPHVRLRMLLHAFTLFSDLGGWKIIGLGAEECSQCTFYTALQCGQ